MARLLRLRGVRIALKPSAEARASLLLPATTAAAPVATPMTLVARVKREGRAGAVQAGGEARVLVETCRRRLLLRIPQRGERLFSSTK